jgi:hypothetical protein
MFGLILACAFAATTQAVGAKMPTPAIAITARFIFFLPLIWTNNAAKSNAGVKNNARVRANVPNDAGAAPCRAG